MIEIAPDLFLSCDDNGELGWMLVDGRYRPRTEGGRVAAHNLGGVQLIPGTAVIGRDASSGRHFILPLDAGIYVETEWFPSEPQWRAACKARGVASPTLAPPDSFGR
jgi:hypothetical protein